MIYCFDLDGTLCEMVPDGKSVYTTKPYKDRITKVNRLFEQGHTIIIETARGSRTGIDHQENTEKQLEAWGLKYNILRTGKKIFADYYIDDKGIKDIDFFK